MFKSKDEAAKNGVYAVVDAGSILAGNIFTWFLVGIAVICMFNSSWWWAGLILIISYYYSKLVSAREAGVIVDTNKNTLEFPAYGLTANGVGDLLSLRYWGTRLFKRITVPLDSLRAMNEEEKIEVKVNSNGDVTREYTYFIRFSAPFGSAYLRTINRNKHEELFGLLRQATGMGYPVVNG